MPPPSSWYRLLHTPAMTQNILHQNPSQLAWSERFRFPLSKHRDQTWVPHRYRVYSSRSTKAKNLQILKPLMQNGTVGDLAEDGAERLEELDNRGLALSSSLPAASEGVPPKSHQHAHPELIWTRMAPMHLPNWWRKGFKPYTKNYRQGGKMGAGEVAFLRTEHTNHHPVPSGQHRKHPCQQHSMDSIG